MRNASRARKMRNHLDRFKRSVIRLENEIIIQTLKKNERRDLSIVVHACLSKRVPSKKNEDSCRWFLPKSHPFLPFLLLIPFLVCLSFLLINFCLLLTTLYISIAQIHTDELSLSNSLSLSLCVFVRVLLLRR